MAEEIIEQGYRELADTILEHNPGVDLGRVRAAFELADRAHSGQKRKAGTPYVTHCVAAARDLRGDGAGRGQHRRGAAARLH